MLELDTDLKGRLRTGESLAGYTSWKVGGLAEMLYRPYDIQDLQLLLKCLPQNLPLFWLGLGSNILVRDGGIPGLVIETRGGIKQFSMLDDVTIRAEAGVPCATAARFCAKQGLVDSEFFAGIPGTVGGALAMNAGAFGGETWDHVVNVETINRQGDIKVRTPEEYQIAYRSVSGPKNEWFVAGTFRFTKGDPDKAKKLIDDLLKERAQKQPTGIPSCGSVFRNPPGDHAARLIDAAGLKGLRCGGAVVSTKHANFIINENNASASDIESLILDVAEAVKQKHNVSLEPEVCIVGKKIRS